MRAIRRCLLAVLLIATLGPYPAACAQADAVPAGLRDLVCMDDGTIWGGVPATKDITGPAPTLVGGGLYRLANGVWQSVPVAGVPEGCRPLSQTRRADGAAVCLWSDGKLRRAFCVGRNGEARTDDADTRWWIDAALGEIERTKGN